MYPLGHVAPSKCPHNNNNRVESFEWCRYATSKSGAKEISLEEYVANMKDEQKNIYYISGDDKEVRGPRVIARRDICHRLLHVSHPP